MLVGYARVSSNDQNEALQIDALKKANCEKIYIDKVSGAKEERVELSKCLESLKENDTLIVWRLDRLGRSTKHLVSIIDDLRKKNIMFKSLSEGIVDTTTASGELVLNMFAALAQFEHKLIQERIKAGMEAARARGKKGGRKKLDANNSKVITAKQLHKDHNLTINQICDVMKITRSTFYRLIKV